jgi:hypothetical protein
MTRLFRRTGDFSFFSFQHWRSRDSVESIGATERHARSDYYSRVTIMTSLTKTDSRIPAASGPTLHLRESESSPSRERAAFVIARARGRGGRRRAENEESLGCVYRALTSSLGDYANIANTRRAPDEMADKHWLSGGGATFHFGVCNHVRAAGAPKDGYKLMATRRKRKQ